MRNWGVNWQAQRCNIVRQLPSGNGSDLGAQRVRLDRGIGRCKGLELGGELTGAMGKIGRGNGANLMGGKCRIGKCNYAELVGELGDATIQNRENDCAEFGCEWSRTTVEYWETHWQLN